MNITEKLQRLWYLDFTEFVIKNFLIGFLWIIGIRKGSMFIIPYFSHRRFGSVSTQIRVAEITGFSIVWETSRKILFEIHVKHCKNNKEAYSSASFTIEEILFLKLSQKWLLKTQKVEKLELPLNMEYYKNK